MPVVLAMSAVLAMPAIPAMSGCLKTGPAMLAGLPGLTGSGVALAILVLLILTVILRALYEPGALEVTRRTLDAGKRDPAHVDPDHGDRSGRSNGSAVQDPVRGETASVRVALFSDLHADSLRIRPETLIRALHQSAVDALIFLGDLASEDAKAALAAPFLSELAAFADHAGIPFFSVPGNHDGPEAGRILESLGIPLLENRQVRFTASNGTDVLITGLADLRSGQPDPTLLIGQTDQPVRIVLAHNPDTILDLPEGGADFFLSGHFHGGQIYAPLQLEFRLLRPELLPRRGIWRGAFRLNGYTGYITRGLGCVWLPLRLFSRPELALLELRVPAAPSGS